MRTLPTLFSTLPTLLCAQSDFAPVGAQWTYDQEEDTYTMTMVGDTLLNGHVCSILVGTFPSICWQSQAYTYQSGDTVFWSDDQYLPQFFELYRWNAQVGESWDVWTNGPVTVTYTVLSTGTTVVNGQPHRTLNVEATDTQMQWAQSSGVLIENIGDTLFMFPWLAAFCDAMAPWPLRCYTDSALGTFLRPGITECALSSGIAEPHPEPLLIARPTLAATGEPIYLTCDRGLLELFDPTGRKVLERMTSGSTTLELERSGTYLLRFTSRVGEVAHQRIMVY
ncbi:MAG: T9SS type A sorting domain-containing protein [Flavobacteriales bacterium]|nr:T9SS type A sorting domain-containing protein [Flavobacteriales bacterium]